jgi:D-aspartate ligase
MTNKIPALVLSTHTSGMGVIRGLGAKGVPVYALSYEEIDMGYKSKYVKEFFHSPHPEKEEEGFLNLLISIYRKIGKSYLIPADDGTLSVVSKNIDFLKALFYISIPSWDKVKLFIDKHYTYELSGKFNIPAPKTFSPLNEEELRAYSQGLMYPCLVKPAESHRYFEKFKVKLKFVHNLEEMVAAYTEAKENNFEVMIQEFIPGGDHSGINYNSFYYNDEPLIEFAAEKVRLSPPYFGVPCVVKSSDLPAEVKEYGKKILNALEFNGYSCTEFKYDNRDKKYKLMEVNGRQNRSSILAVACGINFPWIEYLFATQGILPGEQSYKRDIYWIDEFRDSISTPARIVRDNYSFLEYVKPYFAQHVFATLDLFDIKPFLKRTRDTLKVLVSFIAGKRKKKVSKVVVTRKKLHVS